MALTLDPRTTADQAAVPAVRTRPPLFLTVLAAGVAAGALVPVGYVVWYALGLGPAETWELLARRRVGELLTNTTMLVVGAVALSTVLGAAAAWLVESTDLPGTLAWHGILVAPLAVPAFVNSYAWVSTTHAVQSYAGAVLVLSLSYYPLVYLPVVATLRGLDPALVESAQALGLTRRQALARVTLPLLRTPIAGGALLVGLHTLAEFGALKMLRFPTFTTAIYDQYRSAFNNASANVLAAILVVACLLLLTLEVLLRGRARVARVGAGASRRPDPVRLGRLRLPLLGGLGLLTALSLGLPLSVTARWFLVGSSAAFPVTDVSSALLSTLGLAAVAAALTTVLALPVCWLAVRHPSWVSTVLERATYTAHALPGIVVALALVTVSIRFVPGIYQTALLLLLAYAVLFLPRAMISVRASLEQAPPVLTDVARSLGLNPWQAFVRVTLPLLRPGLGAGAALVFLAVSTELTATLLLSPLGTSTLATEFWAASSAARYGAAAPYAALLIAISVPATVWLARQSRRGAVRAAPSGSRPWRCRMSELVVSGVHKSYGAEPVLSGVDLFVPDGNITAVLGASGCGKTTLLRLLAGFITVDAGSIAIGDTTVAAPGTHVPPQRRGVGYVAQEGALFPHLSVRDNVLFGLPRKARSTLRLHEMLDLAELPRTLAEAYPAELSGGQQQRVAIIRALAPSPQVVLLDEPFSSLDAGLRASAGRGVVRLLRHAGATALLVTHDQDEALSLSDQVAVMRDGRVAQASSPVDLYRSPVDTGVAVFVGGANVLPGRADAAEGESLRPAGRHQPRHPAAGHAGAPRPGAGRGASRAGAAGDLRRPGRRRGAAGASRHRRRRDLLRPRRNRLATPGRRHVVRLAGRGPGDPAAGRPGAGARRGTRARLPRPCGRAWP